MTTVLVVPGIQPARVQSADFPAFGDVAEASAVRTPILTAYRFASHAVQVEDPRVQFSTIHANEPAIERMESAIVSFVENFVGRKSVQAVGQNVQIRRHPPNDMTQQQFFERAVSARLRSAITGTKPAEAELTVLFAPGFCDRARLRIEPSRVDDVEAVWFDFNFHFDLTGGETPGGHNLSSALSATKTAVREADQIASRILAETLEV